MRSFADVRSWLSQPLTGAAETAAAPYWRLIPKLAPRANVVIVRRPVAEVVDSLMRLADFDRAGLTQAMQRADAKLAQAAKRLPNAIEIEFNDLRWADGCKRVFEHCLPHEFDGAWWSHLAPVNVQCDFTALMRYTQAFGPQLVKFGEIAAHDMRANLALRRQEPPEGMTFQEETFERWRADGIRLFEKHCVEVDEAPSSHFGKNWDLMQQCAEAGNMQIVTARSNGRMFGYLMTLLAPSMEEPGRRSAIHTTFFADGCAPGTGLKLQRFALQKLKERGIDEVFFRGGPRGSGPKMGALYRRLGAQPDGDM